MSMMKTWGRARRLVSGNQPNCFEMSDVVPVGNFSIEGDSSHEISIAP